VISSSPSSVSLPLSQEPRKLSPAGSRSPIGQSEETKFGEMFVMPGASTGDSDHADGKRQDDMVPSIKSNLSLMERVLVFMKKEKDVHYVFFYSTYTDKYANKYIIKYTTHILIYITRHITCLVRDGRKRRGGAMLGASSEACTTCYTCNTCLLGLVGLPRKDDRPSWYIG
jgi:hypothetical protein